MGIWDSEEQEYAESILEYMKKIGPAGRDILRKELKTDRSGLLDLEKKLRAVYKDNAKTISISKLRDLHALVKDIYNDLRSLGKI
ncbi:MAG: hypothetical protein FWG60_04375 [Methanomassiliicoccaceae archaeon]|nr:hypothetical protein [Methanomassiliicoccaceae archaeon]